MGSQLTLGMDTAEGAEAARPGVDAGRAIGRSGNCSSPLGAGVTLAFAVEGVEIGPVRSWHPEAQPVAAGPVKVGEYVPRLDVVTAAVAAAALPDEASAGGPEAASRIAGTDDNATSSRNLRKKFVGMTSSPPGR
jgi:hypothetical protein